MIDIDVATRIAEEYLRAHPLIASVDGGVCLNLERTRSLPYGWVFFYNSRRFFETGDILHALGGNAPFLVEAATGRVVEFGTARSVEFYLEEYEHEHGISRGE